MAICLNCKNTKSSQNSQLKRNLSAISYRTSTVHNQSGPKQNIHLHSFTSIPNVKFDIHSNFLLVRPSSKHRTIE